jgi:mono/diheme cytochrome c family protein
VRRISLTLSIGLLLAGCAGLAGEPRIIRTLIPLTPEGIPFPQSTPDLALGAQIYVDRCTECHGLNGAGDGPLIGNGPNQIANVPRSFLIAETAETQTPLDWYLTITNGRIEQLMPPWRDALTDEERWAVTYFTYLLHYDAGAVTRGEALVNTLATGVTLPDSEALVQIRDADLVNGLVIEPATTEDWTPAQQRDVTAYLRSLTVRGGFGIEEQPLLPLTTPEAALTTMTVSGTISNGSTGGSVPPGLELILYRIRESDFDNVSVTQSSTTGEYIFSDVSLAAGDQVYVIAEYNGRPYSSEAVTVGANTSSLDLPVIIFETTADPSTLQIAGWVMQIDIDGGVLRVNQVIRVLNNGDRAYWTDTLTSAGRYAALSIPVPSNAQILSADITNPRYVVAADGQAIVDTSPILPDREHLMNVTYALPYSDEMTINQGFPVSFVGSLRILIDSNDRIVADGLVDLGIQEISRIPYQVYGSELNQVGGSEFSFRVHNFSDSTNVLPIVLIVTGMGLLVMTIIYLLRQQPAATSSSDQLLVDGLVRQIAELDSAYADNQIEQQAYVTRRQRLKDRLTQLMDKG